MYRKGLKNSELKMGDEMRRQPKVDSDSYDSTKGRTNSKEEIPRLAILHLQNNICVICLLHLGPLRSLFFLQELFFCLLLDISCLKD
jgi:hypothetical protein